MYDNFNTIADMQQVTVTGPAAQLPTPNVAEGIKTPERVILQALSTNTAPIFVKDASNVATDGSTGGHELPAGSNIILPLSGGQYNLYYVIASAGSQKLQVTYLGA